MLRNACLVAAIGMALALSACGSLSGLVAHAVDTNSLAIQPVFVASARAQEPDGAMAAGRADTLSYAAYDVSIPPGHQPGDDPQHTSRSPTPARDFIIADGRRLAGSAAFADAVVSYAAAEYGGPSEAFVYVHGFNTSFSEGIYQLAQIGHDLEIPATKVLFSWPSAGEMKDYIHDLDSVAVARDRLEDLLNSLAAAGVKRITVVGYSMGATLVVETLRQMKLVGSQRFFARLGGVVLFSPDMDIDLFRASAERMGGLPQPFVIYGASKDKALHAVTEWLTAGAPRLGAPPDFAALADLQLIFVDVGNVPQAKQPGHLPVATSPEMIAAINRMPRADLLLYAKSAAAGGVAGAVVQTYGKLTYVALPKTVR
jgi:esterase/lipase superfamily enzyme